MNVDINSMEDGDTDLADFLNQDSPRGEWDENRCRNLLLLNLHWVPRKHNYKDGLQIIFSQLRHVFGDDNIRRASGVLAEHIEMRDSNQFPECLYPQWNASYVEGNRSFQLASSPRNSIISSPIVPTRRLLIWRLVEERRLSRASMAMEFTEQDTPTLPTFDGLPNFAQVKSEWHIGNPMLVSMPGRKTRILPIPSATKYYNRLFDLRISEGGKLVGIKRVRSNRELRNTFWTKPATALLDRSQESLTQTRQDGSEQEESLDHLQGPALHNEPGNLSGSLSGTKTTPRWKCIRRIAILTKIFSHSTGEQEEETGLRAPVSGCYEPSWEGEIVGTATLRHVLKTFQDDRGATFDFEEALILMDWTEDLETICANFASKHRLVLREEELPPDVFSRWRQSAVDQIKLGLQDELWECSQEQFRSMEIEVEEKQDSAAVHRLFALLTSSISPPPAPSALFDDDLANKSKGQSGTPSMSVKAVAEEEEAPPSPETASNHTDEAGDDAADEPFEAVGESRVIDESPAEPEGGNFGVSLFKANSSKLDQLAINKGSGFVGTDSPDEMLLPFASTTPPKAQSSDQGLDENTRVYSSPISPDTIGNGALAVHRSEFKYLAQLVPSLPSASRLWNSKPEPNIPFTEPEPELSERADISSNKQEINDIPGRNATDGHFSKARPSKRITQPPLREKLLRRLTIGKGKASATHERILQWRDREQANLKLPERQLSTSSKLACKLSHKSKHTQLHSRLSSNTPSSGISGSSSKVPEMGASNKSWLSSGERLSRLPKDYRHSCLPTPLNLPNRRNTDMDSEQLPSMSDSVQNPSDQQFGRGSGRGRAQNHFPPRTSSIPNPMSINSPQNDHPQHSHPQHIDYEEEEFTLQMVPRYLAPSPTIPNTSPDLRSEAASFSSSVHSAFSTVASIENAYFEDPNQQSFRGNFVPLESPQMDPQHEPSRPSSRSDARARRADRRRSPEPPQHEYKPNMQYDYQPDLGPAGPTENDVAMNKFMRSPILGMDDEANPFGVNQWYQPEPPLHPSSQPGQTPQSGGQKGYSVAKSRSSPNLSQGGFGGPQKAAFMREYALLTTASSDAPSSGHDSPLHVSFRDASSSNSSGPPQSNGSDGLGISIPAAQSNHAQRRANIPERAVEQDEYYERHQQTPSRVNNRPPNSNGRRSPARVNWQDESIDNYSTEAPRYQEYDYDNSQDNHYRSQRSRTSPIRGGQQDGSPTYSAANPPLIPYHTRPKQRPTQEQVNGAYSQADSYSGRSPARCTHDDSNEILPATVYQPKPNPTTPTTRRDNGDNTHSNSARQYQRGPQSAPTHQARSKMPAQHQPDFGTHNQTGHSRNQYASSSSRSGHPSQATSSSSAGPRSRGLGSRSPTKSSANRQDTQEAEEDVPSRPESPSKRNGRSRSPLKIVKKQLFGPDGWFGAAKEEESETFNPFDMADEKQKDKKLMDRLKTKIGEMAEKADMTPKRSKSHKDFPGSPPARPPVCLDAPAQAQIFMETELMLTHSANHFLMMQFSEGRIQIETLAKVARAWEARGRSKVIQFNYDQETQRRMIEGNLREIRWFGPSAKDYTRTAALLQQWKKIANIMSVRTFCNPDSVMKTMLSDVGAMLELLGASDPILLRLQSLREGTDRLIKATREKNPAGFAAYDDQFEQLMKRHQ